MPEFDAYLARPARFFFEEVATADEQRELDRIIRNVCTDPYVDNEIKFTFQFPPAVGALYADGQFWVVYHFINSATIGILNIGYAHQRPTPNRPDSP